MFLSFLPHSLHDTADPRIKHVLLIPKHCEIERSHLEIEIRIAHPTGYTGWAILGKEA